MVLFSTIKPTEMDVMIEITRKIHLYEVLQTPSGRSQFEIYHIDPDRVVIKTKSGTIISIPASCFIETPKFLREKNWVRIGAVHETASNDTLESHLQNFTHGTSVASYVAPILERAGIVEINGNRPAKLRLRR